MRVLCYRFAGSGEEVLVKDLAPRMRAVIEVLILRRTNSRWNSQCAKPELPVHDTHGTDSRLFACASSEVGQKLVNGYDVVHVPVIPSSSCGLTFIRVATQDGLSPNYH